MRAEVRERPFDPLAELVAYQQGLAAGAYGALTSFVGTMRDFNEGDAVLGMRLEHYPGMTERFLERLLAEAAERWPLLDALILHRVGALAPGDPIVLVAVWSAHRGATFEACRFLIERLKSEAPFWKKERLQDGERWVEHNTPG